MTGAVYFCFGFSLFIYVCIFFSLFFYPEKLLKIFHHIFHNHKFVSKQYHSTKKKKKFMWPLC